MLSLTLYTHTPTFEAFAKTVRDAFPDLTVAERKTNPTEGQIVVTRKGGFFGKDKTLTLNHRRRKTPDYRLTEEADCALSTNLKGMCGYLQSIPAENTGLLQKFVTKVATVNAEAACIAEPALDGAFAEGLRRMATSLEGFFFADGGVPFARAEAQHFLDADFRLIVDTAGRSEVEDIDVSIDAALYDAPQDSVTADQAARKSRTVDLLYANDIPVNDHLPCVESEAEVRLRSREEVIDRAYALLVTALRGEGAELENLDRLRAAKRIDALSPIEQAAYDDPDLDPDAAMRMVWRYEALNVMMWVLGRVDALVPPNQMCDVSLVGPPLLEATREDFEAGATLRPVPEILDALDLHYRCHWACVNARVTGKEPPEALQPGVVYERLYALNWLTNYDEASWDHVSTDS